MVNLVEQVVLGLEIVIHRTLGDAGGLDDRLHRCALKSLLGKQPCGSLHEPLRHRAVTDVRPATVRPGTNRTRPGASGCHRTTLLSTNRPVGIYRVLSCTGSD